MLDKTNAHLVTLGLVLITLVAITAAVVLSLADKTIPTEVAQLIPVGFGAIAALSTVRATTSDIATLESVAEPVKLAPAITYGNVTGATPVDVKRDS